MNQLLPRDIYLQKLIDSRENGDVKVVTAVKSNQNGQIPAKCPKYQNR